MPAQLPPPGAEDALYLVDLSSYIFRAYHALPPLSSPAGEPTHATYGTVSMLHKLIGERKPALLAVAMDAKGPTFRDELYDAYKANRGEPPPDLSVQINRSREIVEAYEIPIFQEQGVEADDLIASIAKLTEKAGLFLVIVGADKDLMQLVSERVVLWDTMRDVVYGPEEVEAKFGVPPSQIRDLLALMGDSSDNVPGVPSVGIKTAAELLRQFGSIDEAYRRLDEITKKRTREALAQHEDKARLSQRLVSLRDDIPCVLDREKLRFGRADYDKLRRLYNELGFQRMIATIPAPEPLHAKAERPVVFRSITTKEELSALVAAAKEKNRLAVGVETTSKAATRAVLVGVSLSVQPGEGFYLPLLHRYIGAPKQLGMDEVREILGPVLNDPSIAKVGHDLKYIDVVLTRHGLPLRGITFDTMMASYLVDPERAHDLPSLAKRELDVDLPSYDQITEKTRTRQLGFDQVEIERATAYAAAGIEATFRAAEKLEEEVARVGVAGLMREIEIPLSLVLADMERLGVLVDVRELARLGEMVQGQIAELEAQCKELAGRDFNVASPRQLEVVLFDELKLKPIKRTKTARSTDAEVLEQLAAEHPLPKLILEHRQLSKLKGTYIDALPALIHPETGRVHCEWSQAVAATGRISSNDPNLQNIPIRTELGRSIRKAFVAPEGMQIVSADYSQIELRVLAHLSKDPVLIDAFRRGQDIHTRTAMEVFGVPAEAIDAEHRRRAKAINFGIIYGMGEVALAKRTDVTRAEAASFIDAYFRKYEAVRSFLDRTLEEARKTGVVHTLFGRRRVLSNIRSANPMLRAAAERIAQNTPIQGTAADLLKMAMIRLARPVVPGARMVLTVHDELVFEVPNEHVEEAKVRIRETMQNVAELEVPLVVEVSSGPSWGEAK